MTPNLQIEYRAIDALLPYARNPRTHSPAQITKIAASIVEFGWTQPILVDGDNGIIAGHGRLAAARKLELAEVPVIELGHLSLAQKRAYVIADNRLALDAGWDDELLALELAELSEAGYDLLLTGFDDDELAKMLADLGEPDADASDEEAGADGEEEVPEPPKQPISRLGDVWQLGPHRLICGDASDPVAIATLMQGEQASLCFTSPPYGNQRDYTSDGGDRLLPLLCRLQHRRYPQRYIKGQKYVLLTSHANLTADGRKSLKTLLAANKRLNTAYLLKESFGQLWSYQREGWARRFFENWKASLKWQRLKPYEKFAEMIERHWEGIAAYCNPENKVSLGFVEGLNNKIRLIQRRAYGLRDEQYLRLKILTSMLPKI